MRPRIEAAQTIGVDVDAPDAVIRAAYRELAISCHPEHHEQIEDARMRFREVRFTASLSPANLHCF